MQDDNPEGASINLPGLADWLRCMIAEIPARASTSIDASGALYFIAVQE